MGCKVTTMMMMMMTMGACETTGGMEVGAEAGVGVRWNLGQCGGGVIQRQ